MRVALVFIVGAVGLVACGGGGSATCETDGQCHGQTCARDGECLPASQITSVLTKWTIRGQMANATTCASSPDFYLEFDSGVTGDGFGYAPVPCMEGQFNEDKLPSRFVYVSIGINNTDVFLATKQVDATGVVQFDLSP